MNKQIKLEELSKRYKEVYNKVSKLLDFVEDKEINEKLLILAEVSHKAHARCAEPDNLNSRIATTVKREMTIASELKWQELAFLLRVAFPGKLSLRNTYHLLECEALILEAAFIAVRSSL